MKHRGFSFPFFLRRARWACSGFVGLFVLAGCQVAPQSLTLHPTPNTLVYSYIITNGMARGHIMADRLSDAQLMTLASADHTALMAVILAAHQPTRRNFDLANQAMELYLSTIDEAPTAPTGTAVAK